MVKQQKAGVQIAREMRGTTWDKVRIKGDSSDPKLEKKTKRDN